MRIKNFSNSPHDLPLKGGRFGRIAAGEELDLDLDESFPINEGYFQIIKEPVEEPKDEEDDDQEPASGDENEDAPVDEDTGADEEEE